MPCSDRGRGPTQRSRRNRGRHPAPLNAGASDVEIHDTVLIAAAFCMYNRYVDGLGTWTRRPRGLRPDGRGHRRAWLQRIASKRVRHHRGERGGRWTRPHEQPDADARPEGVPGHAAEHPRPSAAGRGGHRDHPRPRAGCARVPRQCPADPRRHPHVRGHRGGTDVPPAPRDRVAGQRDADRERRGADPPRSPARRGAITGRPTRGTCSLPSPASRC